MPTAQPAELPPAPAVTPDENGQILVLVNDLIRYNVKRMEVRSGELIRVVLRHEGRLPAEAMGHNIVFLRPGVDVSKFALSAAAERDNGFIPPGSEASVLAASELIGGGQESIVEFTAPEPGTYPFVCTFPGHFLMMQGELVVS